MFSQLFRKAQTYLTLLILVALSGSMVISPVVPAQAAFGERITRSGSQFFAGSTRIWINGANTPWHAWNDFGGSYDATWWTNHFQSLHDNGINASRVWLTGDGEVGINISTAGVVSGATAAHWSNLDSLFSIAQSKQIYIMATFLSFDAVRNTHPNYQRWRNMLNSDANLDSYVNTYVIPFVNRYKNNPWVWSIDLMNEPEWAFENADCGNIPWARLQKYFAKAAVGIHANSPILVTVGNAMPKYQSSTCSGCQGDKMSNSALQGQVGGDTRAYLDYRQDHYYPWMDATWGIPMYRNPVGNYGFDTSKPWVIGEFPSTGSTGHTTTQDYENAYLNGFQGAMGWTSNGVDSNGSLTQLGPATTAFKNNHTSLVFPSGSTNKLTNPGFESGTTGWTCNGCTGSAITSPVFAGTRAYQAAARTAAWAGPMQTVTSQVVNGQSRYSEVWVRMSSGTATANVTLEINTSTGTTWIAMTPNATVNSTGWTKLSGNATVSWSGTLNTAKWFVQTTSGTVTFYIDEAKMN